MHLFYRWIPLPFLRHVVDQIPHGAILWRQDFTCLHANFIAKQLFPPFEKLPADLDCLRPYIRGAESARVFERLRICTRKAQEATEILHLQFPQQTCRLTIQVRPLRKGLVLWFCDADDIDTPQNLTSPLLRKTFANLPLPVLVIQKFGQCVDVNDAFCDWVEQSRDTILETTFEQLTQHSISEAIEDLPTELSFQFPGKKKKEALLTNCLQLQKKQKEICLFLTPRVSTEDFRKNRQGIHLIESIPIAAVLLDSHGIVRVTNRLFEKTTRERKILGRHLKDWIVREQHQDLHRFLQQTRRGTEREESLTLKLSASEPTYMKLYAAYVSGQEWDAMGCFLVLLYDITELKRRENQNIEAQKLQALGQLASGISHDFNNLLTAMLGFCDLLLQRHAPQDRSFTDLMQIKQNANRAANLVRQLLLFAKQSAPTLQPIDLRECLSEISFLLRRLIGPKIDLQIKHDRSQKIIQADQGQIEQLIMNLAINARDAMPNGGVLTFTTKTEALKKPFRTQTTSLAPGNYIIISVSDTGCGIAKEHIHKIFHPFFSTKQPGSGTGLGLATVMQILELMAGGITVESQVGKGTTFTLYFPKDPTVRKVVPKSDGTTGHLLDFWESASILIVEDENPIRLFAVRALKSKGYEVFSAKDGEQGLEILRKNQSIQLLVTDVIMPGMDGPTLANTIASERPKLKVLFVSGYPEEEIQVNLRFPKSQVSFLQKPFNLNELAQKVHEILGRNSNHVT